MLTEKAMQKSEGKGMGFQSLLETNKYWHFDKAPFIELFFFFLQISFSRTDYVYDELHQFLDYFKLQNHLLL